MYFDVKWSQKIFRHLKMFELCALDTKYQIKRWNLQTICVKATVCHGAWCLIYIFKYKVALKTIMVLLPC